MVEETTIRNSKKLHRELSKNGYHGESYEDIIRRLLGQYKKESKRKSKYEDSL